MSSTSENILLHLANNSEEWRHLRIKYMIKSIHMNESKMAIEDENGTE